MFTNRLKKDACPEEHMFFMSSVLVHYYSVYNCKSGQKVYEQDNTTREDLPASRKNEEEKIDPEDWPKLPILLSQYSDKSAFCPHLRGEGGENLSWLTSEKKKGGKKSAIIDLILLGKQLFSVKKKKKRQPSNVENINSSRLWMSKDVDNNHTGDSDHHLGTSFSRKDGESKTKPKKEAKKGKHFKKREKFQKKQKISGRFHVFFFLRRQLQCPFWFSILFCSEKFSQKKSIRDWTGKRGN